MASVVSIFRKKDDSKEDDKDTSKTAESSPIESFSDIEARNKANQERIRKERLQANKKVLRSYRIK